MKMLLCGGGTGGHVFPALALARRALAHNPENAVLFVGNPRGIEATLVPAHGYPFQGLVCSGFAARSLKHKVAALRELVQAVWKGCGVIRRFSPDVVVGFGGYVSMPVIVAAALLRVPVVLHEQNAAAGLANRVAAYWARRICVAFPQALKAFPVKKVYLCGNPVRPELFSIPYGGRTDAMQLLVFGGSQGARPLNDCMVPALGLLLQQFPELCVVHQTGKAQYEEIMQAYMAAGYRDRVEVVDFITDMVAAYTQSTLVVCRAGATTVAELAASGRPALLVPFPQAAADHQTDNARALVEAGAAVMIAQSVLTPETMAAQISLLLQNRSELFMMARRARTIAAKGAADLILHQCRMAARKR
ncbi:MAG: undecaprenyldiphospho-muramoylpentapeptide beta-N-acetylglucosaminyltransferase [Desulfuromonadaceae bacterium]|nr:undecaprenyldiphospho-muramoylpentapeptide beta-N-acetylglucosaminyltransferase [Desulfuromonadaceae bacterium]